jgi:hypothetical protein
MRIKLVYLFMFGILCIMSAPAMATVSGPYAVDANTLHLWHLDETTVPAADSAHYAFTGSFTTVADANMPLAYLGGASPNNAGTGGTVYASATLGNASYAGFGTAVDTSAVSGVPPYPANSFQPALNAKLPANGTADNVDMTFDNPTTHAFTFEAIVKIGFDPSATWVQPQEIMSGEGDAGDSSDRSFQFRIQPVTAGVAPILRFQKVTGFGGVGGSTASWNADASIPTTGPDAIVMGKWYHVAVTYNGNLTDTSALKLYWTALDNTSATAATQLAINVAGSTSGNGLMNGWLREQDCDFAIGNEMRDFNGETEPFIGSIDEVRISDVARGAGEMMIVPEPATIVMALIGIFGMGLISLRKRK